jgi:peptide/nickel transport system substrate-binding protein
LKSTRSAKAAVLLLGASMIAAACGSSTKKGGATTAASAATTAGSAAPATEATTAAPSSAATPTIKAPAGGMALVININSKAVWNDGSPITVKDFQCSWTAVMKTPGSNSTTGFDQITSVEQGKDDHQVVTMLKTIYAPYKNLWIGQLIEASKVKNCDDVSADFQDNLPMSARPYQVQSWSKDQLVLVPNDKYWGPEKPIAKKVVMAPKADSDTELASLKSGESDFIFPQAFSGIKEALADPNIKYTPGYGTNYEGLYFQQKSGPFADAVFRKAFAKSVDRDAILKAIYDPIFPGAPLLNCGLWVPTLGKWCDDSIFKGYYDPTGAEKLLTDAGWKKGADGFWADKTGKVPELRWMINAGNKRRENTQALMIPLFAKAGFKVKADNCDAACVFQKRLPASDFDLGMYINTASPDPTVTSIMSCDQVPSDANGNKGQNSTGWCNKEASALMATSDQELDQAKRIEQIHKIGKFVADDAAMISLFQFPNIAAWRTDKLDGPIDKDAGNYEGFQNIQDWKPKSGDQITIGAEQWPDCLNPITECANSSWYVWTTAFKVLPAVWDTTSAGEYVLTALATEEPTVIKG